MAATSKLSYTEEQANELLAAYTEKPTAETVEAFAVKFGKTTKSIIARLARSGVYKKAERVSKSGGAIISKEELASKLGELCGLSENDTSSLAKANKVALAAVLAKIEG